MIFGYLWDSSIKCGSQSLLVAYHFSIVHSMTYISPGDLINGRVTANLNFVSVHLLKGTLKRQYVKIYVFLSLHYFHDFLETSRCSQDSIVSLLLSVLIPWDFAYYLGYVLKHSVFNDFWSTATS